MVLSPLNEANLHPNENANCPFLCQRELSIIYNTELPLTFHTHAQKSSPNQSARDWVESLHWAVSLLHYWWIQSPLLLCSPRMSVSHCFIDFHWAILSLRFDQLLPCIQSKGRFCHRCKGRLVWWQWRHGGGLTTRVTVSAHQACWCATVRFSVVSLSLPQWRGWECV